VNNHTPCPYGALLYFNFEFDHHTREPKIEESNTIM